MILQYKKDMYSGNVVIHKAVLDTQYVLANLSCFLLAMRQSRFKYFHQTTQRKLPFIYIVANYVNVYLHKILMCIILKHLVNPFIHWNNTYCHVSFEIIEIPQKAAGYYGYYYYNNEYKTYPDGGVRVKEYRPAGQLNQQEPAFVDVLIKG